MLNLNFVKWKKYRQATHDGWQSISNLQASSSYDTVVSIGFLIDEDDSKIVLASSMLDSMVNGVFTIPKIDIISQEKHYDIDSKSIEEQKEKYRELKKQYGYILSENSRLTSINEKLTQKVKLNTKTGKMVHDSETLSEVPEEFYGIDVNKFIKSYPNSTYAELSKQFNTNNAIITALVNLLVRLNKIERHPRCNWRRNMNVNVPKLTNKNSTLEVLKEERENLTELPKVFHGIPVNDFIEKYKNMSHKKIRDYYNTSGSVVSALIHILVRLGIVEKRSHRWKPNESDINIAVKRKSFKDSIDREQFIEDFKVLSIKDMVKKYNVSDFTIYTTINHFKQQGINVTSSKHYNRYNPTRIVESVNGKKTKIQILMEKKHELSNLCPTKTQGELAKMYNVSPYTIGTVLHRLGLKSVGKNMKLIYR